MTSDILDKIRKRDTFLKKHRQNKDNLDHLIKYKKYRNIVTKEIRDAKENFIVHKIEEDKNDPKKLWRHLKHIGYKSNKKHSHIVLDIDGKRCYDTKSVANHVNDFFTNIAQNLVNKLPLSTKKYDVDSQNFKNFYSKKGVLPDSFVLQEISEQFVFQELCKLNPNKGTGLDNIQPKFLIDAKYSIKTQLTHIINLSIRNEKVPDEMKHARVTPIFKKK